MQDLDIKCKYCNSSGAYEYTKLCHNCWELEKRLLSANTELINKILKNVKPNLKIITIDKV